MEWNRAFSTTATIAVVAFAGLVLPGCDKKVTIENYDKITIGMTFGEVEGFMGKGEKQEITGTGISAAGIASATRSLQDTYTWREGPKEMSVTIVADRVVGKSKAGF